MPLSTLTDRQGSNWPLTLRPFAWYYAHPRYFTFDDADPTLVASWSDRLGTVANTLNRSGGSHPRWSSNGWRKGIGALDFDGAAAFLLATSGPIVTVVNGTDVPFSVLMTARIDASGDHGIMRWFHSTGTGLSHWRTNNGPPETLRYNRIDDTATSSTVTGTLDVGTANSRFALIYPGTTVTQYRARDIDNNAAACNVGALTADLFEFGRTSVGQLDAAVTEFLVFDRALTDTEVQAYIWYSLREFG